MPDHPVVSRDEWLQARVALLDREKALTQEREELARVRRELPWVQIEKSYTFQSVEGARTLTDLFGSYEQLIVYHFMFGPDWQEGCPACSFWADNYQAALPHLRARDINLVMVSRAPLDTLQAYRERMGWTCEWVSSLDSDFNFDFAVSFKGEDGSEYNYGTTSHGGEEAPGLSVFIRDTQGALFHTYSCYARGLDMLNGTYQHIDLVPRGRNEQDFPFPMAWVRRHDQYD